MKIALCQLNPTIGAIDANLAAMIEALNLAADDGAELVIFPEQAVLGYPAKDLLLRRDVIARNVAAVERLANARPDVGVIIGYAEPNAAPVGRPVHNTAALLADGRIVATWRKRLLPTYDVFDEERYFEPGDAQDVVEFRGRRLGVTICEDLLKEALNGRPLYTLDPLADLLTRNPDLLINISASPFVLNKPPWRRQVLGEAAKRAAAPLLYCNQVGGNDELLFDGASCAFTADGRCTAQARSFAPDVLMIDLEDGPCGRDEAVPAGVASLHAALVMGLRDYVHKCGFRDVVVGLSGGIDSAVVAALAAEALGHKHVTGVSMPSRFSSDHSRSDAARLAENLGVRYLTIPIEAPHAAFERTLAAAFEGRVPDVTEENIQARARGVTLMALSNKLGCLLLTTGNKSELAVGYCTLYGDMCGGLAVISDVPKTMVYALARHINAQAGRDIIPENVLVKPPSAELRPNQTDQDSLPPYDVLDAILERYEERLQSRAEIIAAGFAPGVVDDILRKLAISEYKRQQAAPGLKVTSRAFGFGRRMPIAARIPH